MIVCFAISVNKEDFGDSNQIFYRFNAKPGIVSEGSVSMGHLCCHLPNDVDDSGDNLHVCWTLATLFYTLHWRFQQARRQEMKRGGGVFL